MPTPPSRAKFAAPAYQAAPYTHPHNAYVGAAVPGRPPEVLDFQQGLQLSPYWGADKATPYGAGFGAPFYAGNPLQAQAVHPSYAAHSQGVGHPLSAAYAQSPAYANHSLGAGYAPSAAYPMGAGYEPGFFQANAGTAEHGQFASPYGPELHAELSHASMLASMHHPPVESPAEQPARPRRARAVNVESEIRRCISRRQQEGAYS